MRGRPDVDIRMPPVVHPGADVEVEMIFHSGSDTPVHFVDVTFTGEEATPFLVEDPSRSTRRPITRSHHRLLDAGTLTEGVHRFTIKLAIPQDAPPSYVGSWITIRYELHLHVSIPWWPDLRETYELVVEERPGARPKPDPARKSSADGDKAFVELALADTAFAPGDEVMGALAVGNVARRDEPAIEISLVGTERSAIGSSVRRSEHFRHTVPLTTRPPASGGEVPFRLRVPKEVLPSFESEWCQLTWSLQAALRGSLGHAVTCSIPVTIARYKAPRAASASRLEIGAARWRRIWAEAAEPRGLALDDGRLAIVGTRGEVQIEVTLDEYDDDPALVVSLRYPPLGLGLRVAPQTFIVLPDELGMRLPGHKVLRRETPQCEAFFATDLVGAIAAFKLDRMDETRLVARIVNAGFDEPGINRFLDRVTALVDALLHAMEEVLPPAAMAEHLPAWRAFASATGAHLSVGGMSILGASVDGGVFDLATLFGDGAAVVGTRVELQIDPPLAQRFDLAEPETFSAAAAGARELAAALATFAKKLAIRHHTLGIELDGPLPDPADLRPRMAEMLVLGRRLRGDRTVGPYR